MNEKAAWGVLGMGVMGTSLSRNLARKGIRLALYNRFLQGEEEGVAAQRCIAYPELAAAQPFEDLEAFIQALETPRKVLVMVPSGSAIELVLEQLIKLLSPGDVLIDGGNSHFEATEKRAQLFENAGISFLGMGVSGGEEGALNGPALMVGGERKAFESLSKVLSQIAADNPQGVSCLGHFGTGGAGHYVKMVHNGIEYAEMQLLAEVYECINSHIQPNWSLLNHWQHTNSQSYLLGITASIVSFQDKKELLVHQILDKTQHKGTGSWSSISAVAQGSPATMIQAALNARYTAAQKEYRVKMAGELPVQTVSIPLNEEVLKKAYDLARWINHHQGFELLKAAKTTYAWSFALSEAAKTWTAGCIIQSRLMQELTLILDSQETLLETAAFKKVYAENISSLQAVLSWSLKAQLPMPAMSAAMQYLFSIRQANSSGNLIQAQRDYFGGHGLEWKDFREGDHGPWKQPSQ